MTTTTVQVTDRNFRVTIPLPVRIAEKIEHNDVLEIDVKNLTKKVE